MQPTYENDSHQLAHTKSSIESAIHARHKRQPSVCFCMLPTIVAESWRQMSRKIYLLTFNKLPNRQLAGENSPFTQAYERLDSTSAFFEQHYLQLPGFDAICDNPTAVETLQSLVANHGVSALSINVSADRESSTDGNHLPTCFRHENVADIKEVGFLLSGDTTDEIAWIHCELDFTQSEADQCNQFEHSVTWCRQQATTAESLLIVSSIEGDEPTGTAFESVMFDSLVRVPLWIESHPQKASRVQDSTGSFDVLQTVLQWLAKSVEPVQESNPQTINLIELVQRKSEFLNRVINIRTQDVWAIRTNDFMFCQPLNEQDRPGDFASQPGLYSKPEDIWNIHNVSAEYHDVTRDFQSRLQPAK